MHLDSELHIFEECWSGTLQTFSLFKTVLMFFSWLDWSWVFRRKVMEEKCSSHYIPSGFNVRMTLLNISLGHLVEVVFVHFSSVQSLSPVWLFATPWTTAHQASLSINNSRSLFKLMSIESVMPSNDLILCRPLLLLPPIPPSIRVFSNESALRIR